MILNAIIQSGNAGKHVWVCLSSKCLTSLHAGYNPLHFTKSFCRQCHLNIPCSHSREIANFTRNFLSSKVGLAANDPLCGLSYSSFKEALLFALSNLTQPVTSYPTKPYPTLYLSPYLTLITLICPTLPYPTLPYPTLR
jgi:hypothetical protein